MIALSALFFPHYLGLAIGVHSIARHPGDVIVGCVVIAAIAVVRLLRKTRLYSFSLAVPVLDLVTQLLLVVLGFAFLFSPSALARGLDVGTQPSWHQVAFALPLALLAYTGLETVANLAEETRQPGRDLPRSLFTGDRRRRRRHGADRARRPLRLPGGARDDACSGRRGSARR